MKTIKERTNKGYEIQLYYSKENGKYTSQTGQEREVIQCDNIGEVAQWFARNAWGSIYEDSNIARPTVWLDGMKWCFDEYSEVR